MKKLLKRLLLTLAALFVLALIAFGVLVGINAIDEDLSPEAARLAKVAELPAPSEKNGYVHFLGLQAPEGGNAYAHGLKVLQALKDQDKPGFVKTDGWNNLLQSPPFEKDARPCAPENAACLGAPAEATDAVLEKYRARVEMHRAGRQPADFDEIYMPAKWSSRIPAYQILLYGQYLSLAAAARKADKGDVAGALDDLEADVEYHRRILGGARIIITKMIGAALVARDVLFAAELARAPGADALRERFARVLRPLSAKEADMTPIFEAEIGAFVRGFQTITARELATDFGTPAPWLVDVEILFLRRNETANMVARQFGAYAEILKSTPGTYDAAVKRSKDAKPPETDGFPGFVNPFGKLLVGQGIVSSEGYVARIHDLQALIAAVALQNALRAASATTPEQVEAQLNGDLARKYPNPYTGKPFEYDAKANAVVFTSKNKSSWAAPIVKRYGGKIGIPI